MSLPVRTQPEIPAETARVAQAACKKDNLWLQLRAALDSVYTDELFARLFSQTGRPALAPWRLALVCVLQFAENLSDEQAADAVRTRLDWKYLLALPLEDQGFDASVLCEFRARLLAGQAETLLLDRLLTLCQERGWLKERGRQRTDSTHVVARVHELNRLELAATSLQHALEILAECAPDWLQAHCRPEWVERYAARLSEYRLPKAVSERAALAAQIGADGQQLLSDLWAADAPPWLRALPKVEALRQIWVQQYYFADGQWRWRGAAETAGGLPPCAVLICSPHEVQARYAEKRGAGWTGYKVHLTETCDKGLPHLITQVTTTPATTPDVKALPVIQQELAQHERAPAEQLVDSG
jgi:transposase